MYKINFACNNKEQTMRLREHIINFFEKEDTYNFNISKINELQIMVDIATIQLNSQQFKKFEGKHKKYIGCGIDVTGTYSYITIEFRHYKERQ